MIYIIFTAEGFAEAQEALLAEKATLWINDNILSADDTNALYAQGITTHILPNQVNGTDQKAIVAILEYVENHSPKTEILVEYL